MTKPVTARALACQINNTLIITEDQIAALEREFNAYATARRIALHCLKFSADDLRKNAERLLSDEALATLIAEAMECALCYEATMDLMGEGIARLPDAAYRHFAKESAQ